MPSFKAWMLSFKKNDHCRQLSPPNNWAVLTEHQELSRSTESFLAPSFRGHGATASAPESAFVPEEK